MPEKLPQPEKNLGIKAEKELPQTKEEVKVGSEKLEELKGEDEKLIKTEIPKLHQEIEDVFSQEEDNSSGESENKRKSSVIRLVGKDFVVPREEIMKRIGETFEYQLFRGSWKKEVSRWGSMKEREKTPEELEIISIVNDATNQILEKYDLEKFDIPPENIHVMKRSIALKIYEFLSLSKRQGDFSQSSEAGEIIDPASKMELAKAALHEVIHFKSYNAIQKEMDEKGWLGPYRVGLEVHSRDGKNVYFKSLNEAVTEELTVRTLPQIVEKPVLQDEKNKINSYPSYEKEREYLNDLIDVILKENKDKFKDRDEVFEIFSKAMMTGNILPLGRLVEKTLGKGSFRRIGKLGEA